MAKFKVGDKVRILDVNKILGAAEDGFKTGGIYVLEIDECDCLSISNGEVCIQLFEEELQYIEKVNKPIKNQRITALEKEVAELKTIVHELCKSSTVTEDVAAPVVEDKPKTPNQQRKEIIEKAKEFVDENGGDDYHFEIDEKEGQILAWKVVKRGVKTGLSTCHHNEVFNEDIGRAIAFGRAENLDVSEFENAVQPTEVVVGHVVEYVYPNNNSGTFKVADIRDNGFSDRALYNFENRWADEKVCKILNDTNAIY